MRPADSSFIFGTERNAASVWLYLDEAFSGMDAEKLQVIIDYELGIWIPKQSSIILTNDKRFKIYLENKEWGIRRPNKKNISIPEFEIFNLIGL